jgi:tetratricopeptide (TPR) repeat protein
MLYAQRANVAIERLRDRRSALEDLQKAHALLPKDAAVLDRLAREYEHAGRWREASDAWAALAEATTDASVRTRALLAQSRIWVERVLDVAQAHAILEPLAQSASADRVVLSAFARVCALRALPSDALRAAELYVSVAQQCVGAERVRFWLAAADVYMMLLRDDAHARELLLAAMSMTLADPSLIAPIEQYFARDGAWRAFVALAEDALRRAATPASASTSAMASSVSAPKGALLLRLAIARVLRESLGQPDLADAHLRAAIEAFPWATEPRLARAKARVTTDELGAIAEYREVLEIDPTSGSAFRGLVTALQRIGSTVSAGVVASAALLCGEHAREVEAALALAVTPPPREAALTPDETLALLVGQNQSRFVRRIMSALEPHWFELFPQGAESLRAYTKAPPGIAPLRMLETIARSLGANVAQLYRGRGRESLTIFAQPPALVLGADYFSEGAISHLIFECARMSAHMAGQSIALRVLSPSDLLALLEVLTDPAIDEPGYREMRRRANSVLPRKVRKDIERFVEESGGVQLRVELARWIDEEVKRGLRAGVVFARDLRTVAQLVAPEAASVSGEARRDLLGRNPLMVDALRFCASDACSRALERVFGRT